MYRETRILFSLYAYSSGFEADCGLSAQFGEVCSAAMPGSIGSIRTGESQSVQHRRVEVGGGEGGEGGAGGDVGIADQSMHHRQLPRVIEPKARDALSLGQGCGLSQFLELAANDESFQDVLLGSRMS
jgi:hypothetical protein